MGHSENQILYLTVLPCEIKIIIIIIIMGQESLAEL